MYIYIYIYIYTHIYTYIYKHLALPASGGVNVTQNLASLPGAIVARAGSTLNHNNMINNKFVYIHMYI